MDFTKTDPARVAQTARGASSARMKRTAGLYSQITRLRRQAYGRLPEWCKRNFLVSWLSGLPRPHDGLIRNYRAATLVAIAGIAISVAAFVVVQDLYRGAARQEFDRQAGHYLLALRKAVDRHASVMEKTGELFSRPNEQVDRWEFLEFSQSYLAAHPGFRAVGWVPAVSGAARPAYENRAREDGLHGFQFTEWQAPNDVAPARKRDSYSPVYYVEPFEGNESLLGFDLSSHSSYRSALIRAQETGQMIVVDWSGQSGADTAGNSLLLILPVAATGSGPFDYSPQQFGVAGFLVGLVDVDRLVEMTLREFAAPSWLDTFVFEAADDGSLSLIYIQPSLLRTAKQPLNPVLDANGGFVASVEHNLADWNLSIMVKPVPGTVSFDLGVVPWGVGLVGLLLTGLMTFYLISAQNRQRLIEHRVERRTAELMAANQSNAVLESEIQMRKRIESELRAAKDEAEVASRAKSEFLAMVSHELRTPLNAVIGFSEMLIFEMFGPIGDGRYKGYAEDIRSSGLHLLGLINNILDLSKVEANKFQLNEQNVVVHDLLADALHLVEAKAKATGISVRMEVPKSLPNLFVDERAFKQIVLNLLSNSIKFTPGQGSITVSSNYESDRGLIVVVSDTGIGISAQDLQAVQKPFIQVDSSLARKYEGTGLGLPLTRSLVELHGGTLEIESMPGEGTTAKVIFPQERVIHQKIAAE